MYAYIYMHACNMCLYVHRYIQICLCMYEIFVCVYIHTNIHVCLHTCIHICIKIYRPKCMHHIAYINTSESHDTETWANGITWSKKSCCTSLWSSWPKNCYCAINDAISVMYNWHWCHNDKNILLHLILIVLNIGM